MIESFSLPLSRPLATAQGTIDEREGFLFSRDGGTGEATPLPGWTESLDACERALADADAAETWEDARAACRSTDAPAARHAVTEAELDARAREHGRPLYRELGGEETRDSVPVNATVGDAPVAETVERVAEAVDAGFPAVKIKVGARAVDQDVERLRAVRERSPNLELRADANAAWSEREARDFLGGVDGIDLAYVEQPVGDLTALARLSKIGPVAADESVVERGVPACLDAGVTAIVVKPMALGGLDAARDAALAALDAGVTPVVSNTIDAAVARAGAIHLAASLPDPAPAGLATGDRLARDLAAIDGPHGGRIPVPMGNGHGVGLRESK